MSVRAKFKVSRIESAIGSQRDPKDRTRYVPCEMRTIVLSPVYANGDPTHENSRFWSATPAGEIRLGTVNPEAWQAFELDAEYYIDFTRADNA